MRNSSISGVSRCLTRYRCCLRSICSSPSARFCNNNPNKTPFSESQEQLVRRFGPKALIVPVKPISSFASLTLLRHFSSSVEHGSDGSSDSSNEEVEPIDSWEEEDEAEAEVGDGGDGGGIVLRNCIWGERALSIARELLLQHGKGMEIFAFKTSPRGYIYVRLDKILNEYGCPSMDEIESFSREYKKELDEIGATGEIPDDLALEVSSPGADRLLRVPDDLMRFKDMPMVVNYLENSVERKSIFVLDSIVEESGICVWRLADVKENRGLSSKGRPLSRKQRDLKLKLPCAIIKRVKLYINY